MDAGYSAVSQFWSNTVYDARHTQIRTGLLEHMEVDCVILASLKTDERLSGKLVRLSAS